jgi:hypothetical protein
MKILILDDERQRHDSYDRDYAGHEVWHAYNAKQFAAALMRVPRFDIVSFDHDIGSDLITGNNCAKWMIYNLPIDRLPLLCRVHSWNPTGTENIMATLRSAGLSVERAAFACANEPREIKL